ncbi:hypothetical protein HRJ35_22105 [Shewanella oneidensis MR-1]|uniref:Periplasmic protein in twin arginine protein translocase system locus n=1 Tax=Shewanella oneidensis (strain ATCC 700550 / JCM 31522 / CIP 106686 / LMG 19005 / NCIMB 14063 / MR-1) TaxID=211586 RepID=Q8E9R1_SHEON|nr:hypothetical protein [Shewanella oneidensis]AAN57177.1 putative periplasmic protein in twin arginine protein translocase system locus [Shewanella oneidensis MR-1]MDX5998505.1 hypothetical protein [Shewanella oneidensis]MEE2029695.1 hypothetical protein [Shewanella oneidensis]QKG98437.1 hypothetical protein HRJ35_22105 [Shewanella oneidensis MR-1]
MRFTLLTAAIFMVSAQANAGIEQQLAQCAAMTDKLERLICYDNLASSVQVVSSVPTDSNAPSAAVATAVIAQGVAAPTPTAAASNIEDNFGMEAKRAQEDTIDKLYLDVESIAEDPYGALKITFTNGQVWKQTEGRKYNLKAGEKIFIEKAAFGSFLMGTENRNAKVRVKRLK